jgi:LemA protein
MNTTALVILAVLAVLVVFVIAQYNALVKLNVGVDEAFAQIEVQLQRRNDLIPNLVETVKGYASHEKEALERVVQARAAATSAHGLEQVAAADGMLTQALRGLLAVSEAYPDLKASANFLSLQEELSATENKVGFARQYYNDSVRTLNATVVAIPGKFFAGLAKVTARTFYEVNDPQARTVPKVQF